MLPSAPINKYEHKITHTVYDFSRTLSAFREPNRLRIGAGSPSKIIDIWRPKIPSKKLFEDHRFFLSMQRKKHRMNSSIRNSCFFQTETEVGRLRGNKIKNVASFTVGKNKKEQADSQQWIVPEVSPRNKQKVTKTPYLNFNMQYLIKKRKMLVNGLTHTIN